MSVPAPAPHEHWPAVFGRRRLLLHAGLHKTGTTAVQYFLYRLTDKLRVAGVLYPATGRPDFVTCGHHNIAWQLAGDPRFDAAHGTLDQLAAEIAAFPGDAVLSSEDFASVLDRPERLAPLLRHPALAGHAITLLLTLRDQVSYFEALYVELLRHGVVLPAALVAERAMADGVLRTGPRAYPFDFAALHAALLRNAGLTVALRTYDRPQGGSALADFLAFARLPVAATPVDAALRLNPRPDVLAMMVPFCGTSIKPLLGEIRIQGLLRGRLAHLAPAMRARMAARFAPGNAALVQQAGLPHGSLAIAPAMPADGLVMERLFSAEVHAAILGQFASADPYTAAEAVLAALGTALPQPGEIAAGRA